MTLRVGVDVGGTFTKAVACDVASGEVVAASIVPTTHHAGEGVAAGVIAALDEVLAAPEAAGGRVELVAHSTTQAVNALLEGDTATVGILGLGRKPDLKRSKRRTHVGDVRLSPGKSLTTRHAFVDVTAGIDRKALRAAIAGLVEQGAESICISEAFGIEDPAIECVALEAAADLGVPACGGHELTGLYGLELRTVTGAINASILPAALRTAGVVEAAVARRNAQLPILLMRGDGGACNLATMKRHPLLTAFSGPAASVTGALRHSSVNNAIVVEVGGTSTNISLIKGGRPLLSYVRVLDHVTCVRALDVRVVGVAGGSLMRVSAAFGRPKMADVGPRSAHIAGLPYACFAPVAALQEAKVHLSSPRPGDPPQYVVLEGQDGARYGVTVTCAANALGVVPDGAYATADAAAARAAFVAVGKYLRLDWKTAAGKMLGLAAEKVGAAVSAAAAENEVKSLELVGVGGGAGALLPAVADKGRFSWRIPRDAEVISSIGDALSIVRVEIERSLARPSPEDFAALHREAERAALAAGASPSDLQIESHAVPERRAVRVAAFGSAAVGGTRLLADPGSEDGLLQQRVAEAELGSPAKLVAATKFYSVYTGSGDGGRFAVVDRSGAVACAGKGRVISGPGASVAAQLEAAMPSLIRHYGPLAVAPAVRMLRGARLVDLTTFSTPDHLLQAAAAECATNGEDVVALVSRS